MAAARSTQGMVAMMIHSTAEEVLGLREPAPTLEPRPMSGETLRLVSSSWYGLLVPAPLFLYLFRSRFQPAGQPSIRFNRRG